MLIVHREGRLYLEHAVRITDGESRRWHLNPKEEVRKATGVVLNRQGSIYSFADGLMAAGHTVRMKYHANTGRLEETFHLQRQSMVFLPFFLVGLAWGKDEWPDLMGAVQRYVVPCERLAVLENTARIYYSDPWISQKKLHLHIP